MKDWRKQLKKYYSLPISLFLLNSSLLGQNTLEESILSDNKNKILNYSYEKNIEDNAKLVKDNVKPNIEYSYSYNDDETYQTKSSTISVNQPIFKSGGIYNAIKYASSLEKYSNTSIDIQKQELIKQAINTLFEIKINEISIQKQKLVIQNAKIDIQRKKEQVLNGILDASYLDNAILDANTKKNSLIDLQLQKKTLINSLSTLTDKKYNEIKLPVFKLTGNKEFKENNIYIKQLKQDVKNSYYIKNMAISQYLPNVNLIANYNKYHDIDNNPKLREDGTSNIGLRITIPLDISFNNDIQSNKIDYLQKKLSLDDKIKEEMSLYKTSIANIESIDEKIKITKDDIKLYDSLLVQLQEQYQVGMKTLSDVQTMENSKKIKSLDIKTLELQKQIKLLDIYSRLYNE